MHDARNSEHTPILLQTAFTMMTPGRLPEGDRLGHVELDIELAGF